MKEKKPAANGPIAFYGSKEGNDISMLLECRTVIEKKDFVATGTLTYAHGDIIEVEFPQSGNFSLKDPVKVIIYTRNGMFVFESTVIAKSEESLIIINPPENRRKFVDKREHPRVEVAQTGLLSSIQDHSGRRPFDKPIELAVNNISLSGAGFTLNYDLGLTTGTEMAVELDLGFVVSTTSEIVRKSKTEEGYFYGTRFLSISTESAQSLRAFVLRTQIELYFRQKRLQAQKEIEDDKAAASG